MIKKFRKLLGFKKIAKMFQNESDYNKIVVFQKLHHFIKEGS